MTDESSHRLSGRNSPTDHHVGPALVELGLGDSDGGGEIVVGQLGIQDLVAVGSEANASKPIMGKKTAR
ncbi:MAG: hypothetical protein KJ000_12290 [Pirellulaceae bacterium]|nr:hypothetical protein [Pirellulaceae bacterium]